MENMNLSDTVTIEKVSEKNNTAVFNIENLYTGYGLTLGNSLRRVLLSSLPGAAIVQIKIKNVDHEFSTLPGLVEDIVEFTLNLKRIRFVMHTDEPQTLTLSVKGAKEVTTGDIKTTTFVDVTDPEQKIATLTKKSAELDMEMVVERGLGYLPSDQRKTGRLPVGTIMLDAIFSPVIRVDFDVEDMRVGEKTNYNRIKLEVETDGTITPSEAVYAATGILKSHFEKIYTAHAIAPKDEVEKETKTKAKKEAKPKTEKKKETKAKKST